jgi:hypothetical protein
MSEATPQEPFAGQAVTVDRARNTLWCGPICGPGETKALKALICASISARERKGVRTLFFLTV